MKKDTIKIVLPPRNSNRTHSRFGLARNAQGKVVLERRSIAMTVQQVESLFGAKQ